MGGVCRDAAFGREEGKRRRIDAPFFAEPPLLPDSESLDIGGAPAEHYVLPAPTTLLQRVDPPHGEQPAPPKWNPVAELAALAAEELTQAAADRLFKVLSHPETDLGLVTAAFCNKSQWLDYLNRAAAEMVSLLSKLLPRDSLTG